MSHAQPRNLTYPCYVIYRDHRREWRWDYYNSDGEIISTSKRSYESPNGCEYTIRSMKESLKAPVIL
mgnify:CR=1 FL=1